MSKLGVAITHWCKYISVSNERILAGYDSILYKRLQINLLINRQKAFLLEIHICLIFIYHTLSFYLQLIVSCGILLLGILCLGSVLCFIQDMQ